MTDRKVRDLKFCQLFVKTVIAGTAALFLLIPSAHAEPTTLEQAWVLAYRNNPSLQARRAELRALDEQVSQALSHWRPSIDATGSVGRTYQYAPQLDPFGDGHFSGTARSYGAQVTQPLFRGFRTRAETESAGQQVEAGRARLESSEQQLFLDTASAFLGVLRDDAILTLERQHERILEEKLEETRVRAEAGELTQTDVRQAESRLARAHVSRYQAENALTQDRAAYVRLVGSEPDTLVPPALPPDTPKTLSDLFEAAETKNPDVIASLHSVGQAKADIRLNRGGLLPEINLVGSSQFSTGQSLTVPGRSDSSQVLVQMTVPLYRSGTDYSKTRAAQQTLTQRAEELDEARHRAHEQANDAWQALMTGRAAMESDESGVKAAAEALEGVKRKTESGLARRSMCSTQSRSCSTRRLIG
ncbi:MAG: TolC family outer membrane protein [Polyangiaceae bacterium]